ncbi:hypothetical protein EJB05_06300, partial [Eragrostis curvula]
MMVTVTLPKATQTSTHSNSTPHSSSEARTPLLAIPSPVLSRVLFPRSPPSPAPACCPAGRPARPLFFLNIRSGNSGANEHKKWRLNTSSESWQNAVAGSFG